MVWLAGLGAALGAVLRYEVTAVGKKLGWEFWITALINLSGAFLLGLLFGLGSSKGIYAFIGTGILGGYTTFSTMNSELVSLLKGHDYRNLLYYLLVTYLGGLILVYGGWYLGRLL